MQKDLIDIIPTSSINPVDYCNIHKVQEVFDFMLTINNIKQVGIDSFTYIQNKHDETVRMFVLENKNFRATVENGLRMPVNKDYTPFMMLQKYKFKNNFSQTMYFVMKEYMYHKCDYIRVGVKYFKVISKVDRYNITRTTLKLWEKSIINDDLGKNYLNDIPKYDDFTIVPDNKNYSGIIGNNYNLYSEFSHEPLLPGLYEGKHQFPWIDNMINHIFGEQYELGLKYLKILYDDPTQILPILVLVSTERQTGKSTFVDFLTVLFGANMVVINPQDIGNDFNGSYADKNIIAIEESKFESTQATEKLKSLSTQKKIMVNTKFIPHYSLPFYGKLIITSNDENKFSKVDNPEIRYWVRKVPSLEGKGNHDILDDMTAEIPYFLSHLDSMEVIDVTKSRMVFTAVEIKTNALDKVKKESLPALQKEIMILLDNHCAQNQSIEEFYFTALDIKTIFFDKNSKYEMNYINRILKVNMELEKVKQKRYIPLENENSISKVNGRPYKLVNEYFLNPDYESNI